MHRPIPGFHRWCNRVLQNRLLPRRRPRRSPRWPWETPPQLSPGRCAGLGRLGARTWEWILVCYIEISHCRNFNLNSTWNRIVHCGYGPSYSIQRQVCFESYGLHNSIICWSHLYVLTGFHWSLMLKYTHITLSSLLSTICLTLLECSQRHRCQISSWSQMRMKLHMQWRSGEEMTQWMEVLLTESVSQWQVFISSCIVWLWAVSLDGHECSLLMIPWIGLIIHMDGTPVQHSHKMSQPKLLSSWLFILVASFGNIHKDCVAQCSSPW